MVEDAQRAETLRQNLCSMSLETVVDGDDITNRFVDHNARMVAALLLHSPNLTTDHAEVLKLKHQLDEVEEVHHAPCPAKHLCHALCAMASTTCAPCHVCTAIAGVLQFVSARAEHGGAR